MDVDPTVEASRPAATCPRAAIDSGRRSIGLRYRRAAECFRGEARGPTPDLAIELAALLGVRRVVTMSGLPATDAHGTLPAWSVLPWDSAYLDSRDYQWSRVAIPYWKDIQARAADADVKVCIEMHPHNVVPPTHSYGPLDVREWPRQLLPQ